MFTGIIEATGTVSAIAPRGGDLRISIGADRWDMNDIQLGDSIASNGVCLTVIAVGRSDSAAGAVDSFSADVSTETLALTTLDQWQPGKRVNLEKALTPQTPMGGHFVSGHVDGIGEVISRHSDARAERLRLRAPAHLAKYIAQKGAITVDGTSLTVNAVDGAEFELAIVPHTLENTILGDYAPGTQVNLEIDLIARYLERLLLGDKAAVGTATTPVLTAKA
ncbi:MAG: riboflavin synthase [Cellvibrionaceae bacterium]|nr:riboflavin synthase [Cellvibrionaceae bacterium]